MSVLPPPPPPSLPEEPPFPRQSRYRRRRRFVSWWGVLLGLVVGLAGALYYTWEVNPIVEINTRPRQLRAEEKAHYIVAIMLAYRHDGNLDRAIRGLIELDLGPDPIQAVADTACDLARSGYVNSNSGLSAVRALKTFYQLQGRSGCADALIPDVSVVQVATISVPTNTPTLVPPPTKTPTPPPLRVTPTDVVRVVPTVPPRLSFTGLIQSTFCDAALSGIIEVFVQDADGRPLPGQAVRVRWEDGEDRFVTGLKPERGLAYADFEMEAGRGYIIDMPGQSNPLPQSIVADPCLTEDGVEAITSYRVVFRQTG